MKKIDLINLTVLLVVLLVIFYPVFYAEYLYTDESVQIWFYKQTGSLEMFLPQGRYLTEKLMQWLFGFLITIKDLTYLRIFSLLGWGMCIPIWYYVIKQLINQQKLPHLFAFFSVIYLISMPSVAISIGWATCAAFLANTAGLLSGYVISKAIKSDEKGIIQLSTTAIILSVVLGLISLFSYQSAFGCFLIPFILQLIFNKKFDRSLIIGVSIYLVIYGIYYMLFKYNLKLNNISASDRTGLYINPWGKLKFFFSQPLASAFHFTYLFNEKSKFGLLLYRILLAAFILYTFWRYKSISVSARIQYIGGLGILLLLMYIPSLIVKENYASNRTLLALNMGVFLLVTESLSSLFSNKLRYIFVYSISLLLVINAWYNFNFLFLKPITQEYSSISTYLKENYSPEVNTISFVRPPEDLFVQKFGITRSWDEFGVPSTHFNWVPEPYVKQMVFEITGNRVIAEKLVVKHNLQKLDFIAPTSKAELLLDATDIIINDNSKSPIN